MAPVLWRLLPAFGVAAASRVGDFTASSQSLLNLAADEREHQESGARQCQQLKVKNIDKRFFDHDAELQSAIGLGDYSAGPNKFQVVVPRYMSVGEKITGECSELIRSMPFMVGGFRPPSRNTNGMSAFSTDDENVWDSVGIDTLFGSITISCREVNRKAVLDVDDHDCREVMPFSITMQMDRASIMNLSDTRKPWWEAKPCEGPCAWSQRELKFYQCSKSPREVILQSGRPVQAADVIKEATEACATTPGCEAVAVDKSGGEYHLLKKLVCNYAPHLMHDTWEEGTEVIFSGWPDYAPSTHVGRLMKPWTLGSKNKILDVEFSVTLAGLAGTFPTLASTAVGLSSWSALPWLNPDYGAAAAKQDFTIKTRRKLHISSVAKVSANADWTVIHNLRPRNMVCRPLKLGYSCNAKVKDSKILSDEVESIEECQEMCQAKAEHAKFSLAEKGCCVFINNMCALTSAEAFKIPSSLAAVPMMFLDPTQQRLETVEAAGECYDLPCSSDPTCSVDSETSFIAPENAAVGAGELVLYFDFAHPFLFPFYQVDGGNHPAIFHRTSASPGINKFIEDSMGMVRAVGSVPGMARDSQPQAWKPSTTGYVPSRTRDSLAMLGNVSAELREVCAERGLALGRSFRAPRLTESVWEECIRLHRTTSSPYFEPCLMQRGCARVERGAGYLPFNAPWFSKLPFDMLAWQQPVPFCCALPYNQDMRDEYRMHEFFKDIDFQDPDTVDLGGVPGEEVRANMEENLKEGGAAIKKMLATEMRDSESLVWLGGFINTARDAMSHSMKDFVDAVNAESGDGEEDDAELSPDGTAVLQVHEDGDHLTAAGRRAFRIAEYSHAHGTFVQLGPGPTTNSSFWGIIKQVPGAIFNFGIKPLWKYILQPLVKWGISVTKWIMEHPRTALFMSKFALAIRDRMCEKASYMIYETPETREIGLFAKSAERFGSLQKYLEETFSPAVLLVGLKEALKNSRFAETMKSIASASFGLILSFAGIASGGAVMTIVGNLVNFLTDASLDAGKQALEFMIYKEIAKEIPSNLYDFLLKKCLFKREPKTTVTLGATAKEISGAANKVLTKVAKTLEAKAATLGGAMDHFAEFFDEAQAGSNWAAKRRPNTTME